MQTLNLLAGIAYDPTIRGLLSVGVGVVVLMGSVYLILATNTGNRLGFLLAATGFFGWMAIMGVIWWIYGIGMKGDAPSWQVVEYNANTTSEAITEKVQDLDLSTLPQGDDGVDYDLIVDLFENDPAQFDALENSLEESTDGWKFLPASDPARGEAEATVAATLPECSTCNYGIQNVADYKVLGAFEVGGKAGLPDNPNRFDRIKTQVMQHADHQEPQALRRGPGPEGHRTRGRRRRGPAAARRRHRTAHHLGGHAPRHRRQALPLRGHRHLVVADLRPAVLGAPPA